MNFRTTLFLLVLVVAVGIAVVIVNSREDKTKTTQKTDEHKIVDIDSADVTGVTITASDDRHIVLQKTGADWRLTQPVAARAKAFEVDDLVRALVGLQSHEQLDESKKTSGGLDHPSFVIELTTKNKGTTTLTFGDKSTMGDSLYVLVNDSSKPQIVGNSIYATLDKPASAYRDMKLVNTPSIDVKQLAISNKGKTILLQKTGENWEVTEPEKMPAETSEVTDLISGITGLDATAFVEKPKATVLASVNHPRLTVTFSTQASAKQPAATQPASTQPEEVPQMAGGQTIRFGGYTDVLKKDVFASLDGTEVAVVPASAEKTFEKTTLDLRNRDVMSIAPDRVSSFTVAINRPATTQPTTRPAEIREFTIERHKVAPPTLGPALPGGVTVPSTQPTADATTQPASATTETLAPATQPAIAASQPSSATTHPAIATTQPSAPATQSTVAGTQPSTTQPAVASTEPSSPTTQPGVAMTQPTTQRDELATAKWIFVSGNTGAADEGQVTALLDSLHPLRAEKYLEPGKVEGATYKLTIHAIPATAAEAAEDYVLTFVDTGGRVDGFYKDLHFTVDRSLIDKLTGDFKTKKPAPPAPPSFNGAPGGSPFGG